MKKVQAQLIQKNQELEFEKEAKTKLAAELDKAKILASEASKLTGELAEAKRLLAE